MAITNSKQAADFLNKRAPKGESLAFINESEARLLKANGGMGLPLPNTGGVPVYGFWGDAWDKAVEWGTNAVKNVDFGEWVDIGTKAWDTYTKYKSEKGKNEAAKATYDKYLQDTADYERAAEIAIAENLTPMAVAKPALTKADITDFTLVKDGGIIGLKNGGRPGYMMGDMVMEETTMAAAPADIKESLNSIPPEMQAISQELFQKAVEELTEQELQMLMAYMQKAAMETATAQAPMEEEMMTSETIMAANGGIMNNKRGFVDGPGGYAGEIVEPRGNPGVVTLDTFEDPRIVPEEFALEPENRNPEIFEDSGDQSILEISDEQSDLMQGGEQYNKEYFIVAKQIQERFPEYTLEQIIAEMQQDIALMTLDENYDSMLEKGNMITGTDNVLKSITPESVQRTIQRFARGDTQYGNVPNDVMMNSGGGAGIEALRKVRPDVVEKMGFNKGGGAGIEALRKVRPDVVETMGFNMGGRARYADGPMDPSTDAEIDAIYGAGAAEEGMNLEPNDMNLGNEMASLDSLTEEYNKYVFEMEEMGLVPMGIEQFRDQAIAEGKMASAPDASSELNDAALNVYGVPLNELSDEQIETLKELQMNRSMPQDKGIMMAARGGRAMYAYGQGPVMNQGIGTMMANDGMEMLDMGGMEKDYRFNGGFVPMGEYEKKDDVPARLSKNEFVFTADAVRAAGGGSIKKGAQKMYDTMKNLEANV